MTTVHTASVHDPTEAEIQQAAYYIWLASGCLPGRDQENWFAAKEYLKHHHGRVPARPPGTPPDAPVSAHHLINR